MKHTTLLIAAVIGSASLLAGCADDSKDAPDAVAGSQAIRFAATATPIGRAVNPPFTTASLDTFTVYAYQPGVTAPYMDSVTVARSASGQWTYSPEKYWPATSLDFYAYAPQGWVGASGPLSPVVYSDMAADTDLIYSVVSGASRPLAGEDAQVSFTFRHALARATFNLCSTDSLIDVKVCHISVHGLYTAGEFSFPEKQSGDGAWSALSDNRYYLLYHSISSDDYIKLTTEPTQYHFPGQLAQYFIPQALGDASAAFVEVQLQIYDRRTGAQVWPNSNTPSDNIATGMENMGEVRFALATPDVTEWKAAHHYVYNIGINTAPGLDPIEFGGIEVENYVTVDVTEP